MSSLDGTSASMLQVQVIKFGFLHAGDSFIVRAVPTSRKHINMYVISLILLLQDYANYWWHVQLGDNQRSVTGDQVSVSV